MCIPYFIYLDYRLAIIVTITSIIAAFINLKYVQPIRNQYKDRNSKLAKLSEVITENITGFRIVKMFGLERYFSIKLDEKMNNIYDSEYKFVKTETNMKTLSHLVHSLSYIIISFVAGYLVIQGDITAGSLVSAVMVSGNLAFHFLRVGQNTANIQRAFAGLDRVNEFYSEPAEPSKYDTGGCSDNAGISIQNGEFSYIDGVPVIKGMNISVPQGEMVALVGDSGGGKSTLVKLILGHYKLDKGNMTISGKPVREYTLDELRKQTAYVPQDAYIFNGTIRENVLYGNHLATDNEIILACQKANAHDFIQEQHKGYLTLVGEKGIRLSGGQRQRIAIARAILKDAPILVLDEATSSLDSVSEQLVQESLDEILKEKTSLVVAHRLSTITKADTIYFIKDGKVAEEGTHKELLEKDGLYARQYYTDFADTL